MTAPGKRPLPEIQIAGTDGADLAPGEKRVNADGSVSYALRWPFVAVAPPAQGGEPTRQEVSRITLRRLKAADQLVASKAEGQMEAAMIALERLSGRPRAVIEALDAEDADALSEILLGFTRPGRPTGRSA